MYVINVYIIEIKLIQQNRRILHYRKLYVTKSVFLIDVHMLHYVSYTNKFLYSSSLFSITPLPFNHKELSIADTAALPRSMAVAAVGNSAHPDAS